MSTQHAPIGSNYPIRVPLARHYLLGYCDDRDSEFGYQCSRPAGHRGRHHVHWFGSCGGVLPRGGVIAVWGDDQYAETRARGRAALQAKANARLFDVVRLIDAGADPDDAWVVVETLAGVVPQCVHADGTQHDAERGDDGLYGMCDEAGEVPC